MIMFVITKRLNPGSVEKDVNMPVCRVGSIDDARWVMRSLRARGALAEHRPIRGDQLLDLPLVTTEAEMIKAFAMARKRH